MMILSAQSIRARCLERTPPLLTPFVERSVSPGGRSFGLSSASYDVRIDQDAIIPARGFVLTSTVERFAMPNDLAGTVRDKSSWARVGLAVQNTHLDPGWCGYLTLELSNHFDAEIRIARGEPIAQIVFELLDQPTEQPVSSSIRYLTWRAIACACVATQWRFVCRVKPLNFLGCVGVSGAACHRGATR